MKRGIVKFGNVLVAATLLIATAGCNEFFIFSNAASVVTGWLLGGQAAANNVERQCYQNGVLIDCADLPADLGQ